MQDFHSPVRAAIDIGSNTIHIVVARATPLTLDILADEVDITRIGASVNATGKISEEKCSEAIRVLRNYQQLAQQHEAEQILVVATEAIRQAENSGEFIERVRQESGLEVQLISGEAEAFLTFLGATYETFAQPVPPAQVGVLDLGGGSLELVMARHFAITWKTSVPIGSGWLHDRYLAGDPPTAQEVEVAETFLRTYFSGMRIKQEPPVLIVTGGSANSLLYLARRAFGLPVEQNSLSLQDLLHCQGLLRAFPAQEIAMRFDQPVARARILLAGSMIIQHVMNRLGLDEIQISPHGIREGVLLARERYGASWLPVVSGEAPEINHHDQFATGTMPIALDTQDGQEAATGSGEEPFIQAGWRMLHDRLEKLLEWTDEVLRHDDIEAVHKMRVATRRLRATLDAYQSCCEPHAFKKVYRSVKKMADVLGAARDSDVMIQNLQGQLAAAPGEMQAGIQWMIARLQSFRQQKQRELEDYLKHLDEDVLREQVDALIPKGVGAYGQS
jgi:hypothetical protein